MFRFLAHLFQATVAVTWRRARFGARLSSWSFGFEVLVAALRLHTRWLAKLPIPALRQATAGMLGPMTHGVTSRADHLAGVPVTWFEPGSMNPAKIALYLHGGGYVFGSAAQDRGVASRIARALNVSVAAPDYRLAPEAPYPAAVDDVVAVYRELCARRTNVVLVGLSSGAGLAVALLARLRAGDEQLPTGVILLSPLLDATCSSATWSSNEGVDWGAPSAVAHWTKLYAGDVDRADPGISPVNADLKGIPPILVVSGAAELLHDDARCFVERALGSGVSVSHHVEPDMVHAFMTLGRDDGPTTRTFERIAAFAGAM